MNSNYMTQREFEASMKVGDRVYVRWRQVERQRVSQSSHGTFEHNSLELGIMSIET